MSMRLKQFQSLQRVCMGNRQKDLLTQHNEELISILDFRLAILNCQILHNAPQDFQRVLDNFMSCVVQKS